MRCSSKLPEMSLDCRLNIQNEIDRVYYNPVTKEVFTEYKYGEFTDYIGQGELIGSILKITKT